MKMAHVVRVRARVIRLRRRNTWPARKLADRIEADLLSRMSWTR